ncbi:hypothetical protein [Xylanibacillus composti]|nr:hypothetical protein [Xylanibacillus composti]
MAIPASIIIAGLIATILIGASKANKEGNPAYFQQTGKKWMRLSWYYIWCILLAVLIFWIVFQFIM